MLCEAEFFPLSMGTFCIWTDDLIASLIGICANTLWSCLGSPPPSHLYPNPSLLHIEFPRAFLVACPAVCTLICRHQPGCCWTWGAPSALCFQSFCPDGISSALLSQQRACVQKRRKTGGSSGNPTFHGRCVTPAWTIARQQWLTLCALLPFCCCWGSWGSPQHKHPHRGSGEAERGITPLMWNNSHTCKNNPQQQDNFQACWPVCAVQTWWTVRLRLLMQGLL